MGRWDTASPSSFSSHAKRLQTAGMERLMFPDITRDDVFRLETPRLWLTWPRACDADAVRRIASRREVAEMTAQIPHPYPPDAADAWILGARAENASGQGLRLVARLKHGKRSLIGFLGLGLREGVPVLGYAVDPERWGEGLATEAAAALVDMAFSLTAVDRISADVRVHNPTSQRVLRKLGFDHAGPELAAMAARGGLFPVDRFRLEREVWRGIRRRLTGSWSGPLPAGHDHDWSTAEAPT
jgi:RimJ/RimL family protein N-acetyltransferase